MENVDMRSVAQMLIGKTKPYGKFKNAKWKMPSV